MKTKPTTVKKTAAPKKRFEGFTAQEKGAMKARVQEMKTASTKLENESAALAAIAGLPEPDRALAKKLHALIQASAPALSPKTWYGMPAYEKDGKIICHFQPAHKFKTRYATLGFSDAARLDEGNVWPVAYSLTKWTPADESRIAALIKKAVS